MLTRVKDRLKHIHPECRRAERERRIPLGLTAAGCRRVQASPAPGSTLKTEHTHANWSLAIWSSLPTRERECAWDARAATRDKRKAPCARSTDRMQTSAFILETGQPTKFRTKLAQCSSRAADRYSGVLRTSRMPKIFIVHECPDF